MTRIPDEIVRSLKETADLEAVAEALGLALRRKGGNVTTSVRDEAEPSTVLYPLGSRGARNPWPSWRDYGTQSGGDVFALVELVAGCSFGEAVRYVAGVMRCPLDDQGEPTKPLPAFTPPRQVEARAELSDADQLAAVAAFLEAVRDVVPDAAGEGESHLLSRGVDAATAASSCLVVPAGAWREIGARAMKRHDPARLLAAGLLREDRKRPGSYVALWWLPSALYLARSLDGGRVGTFTARRLDGEPGSKYMAPGGRPRFPFNLPDLEAAAAAGERVLIVEGAADAFAARSLGLLAIATGGRPQVRDEDDEDGGVARMLRPYLERLRECSEVLVVPDADDTRKKEREGIVAGERLVAWLRNPTRGVWARVELLPHLGIESKDMAAEAAARLNRGALA